DEDTFSKMKSKITVFLNEVLGIYPIENSADDNNVVDGLMSLVIQLRKKSRENKDYSTSDLIRDELRKIGIQLKDGKDGTDWNIE
ncbi:MAG: cysteine--tRNA ligase, partial [Chitinophagales bacterium]|nr:cysteine--tRNA ligase [Chitinophagales bacterium]